LARHNLGGLFFFDLFSYAIRILFETLLPLNMLGIKIKDKRLSNSFDLRDILAVIGEPVNESRWSCYDLCYTANKDGRAREICEERLKLSGKELTSLASEIHQTIDGRFEAKSEVPAKNLGLK
jgi:hypothetical protein